MEKILLNYVCPSLELMEEEIVSVEELEKMIYDSRFVQGAGQAAWLKWKMRG